VTRCSTRHPNAPTISARANDPNRALKEFLLRQSTQLLQLAKRTQDEEMRHQLIKIAFDCLAELDALDKPPH
jgi:hypothetical protein